MSRDTPDDCPDCETTMSVVEPAFYEYTAWAFDNQDTLLETLRDAGASPEFRRFVKTVDRGTRHSVLMTLFRHHGTAADGAINEGAAPNVDDCQEAYRCGGGFFKKMWDGHIADAYCHADGNNRPMLEREFSKEEIVEQGLSGTGPFSQRDYLSNLIDERWDR